MQVLAGGRLLAHSKEFAKSGQSVQIWIEYTPESQLLSIFAADHSLRGFKVATAHLLRPSFCVWTSPSSVSLPVPVCRCLCLCLYLGLCLASVYTSVHASIYTGARASRSSIDAYLPVYA